MKTQYYGIKFPFTINNNDELFMDLNTSYDEKVASDILHVILTTKGTRIMMPNFGTRLIDYIFNLSDESEWESVEEEIKDAVKTYVPGATLQSVDVTVDEYDDNAIYLDIHYAVNIGTKEVNKRMAVKI